MLVTFSALQWFCGMRMNVSFHKTKWQRANFRNHEIPWMAHKCHEFENQQLQICKCKREITMWPWPWHRCSLFDMPNQAWLEIWTVTLYRSLRLMWGWFQFLRGAGIGKIHSTNVLPKNASVHAFQAAILFFLIWWFFAPIQKWALARPGFQCSKSNNLLTMQNCFNFDGLKVLLILIPLTKLPPAKNTCKRQVPDCPCCIFEGWPCVFPIAQTHSVSQHHKPGLRSKKTAWNPPRPRPFLWWWFDMNLLFVSG